VTNPCGDGPPGGGNTRDLKNEVRTLRAAGKTNDQIVKELQIIARLLQQIDSPEAR
jgi:hypothetical protein